MLSRITKYRATRVSILEIPIVGLIILRVYPDILLQQFIVSLKVTNKLNPSLVIKRPIKIMLKSNSCPRRSTMSNIKSSWHERDKEPIAIQQAAVKNETWRAVKTKTDAAVQLRAEDGNELLECAFSQSKPLHKNTRRGEDLLSLRPSMSIIAATDRYQAPNLYQMYEKASFCWPL